MAQAHASTHPLVQTKLARLRDQTTPPPEFRRLVGSLTLLIAQEATTDLPTREVAVHTPLGIATCKTLDAPIVIVPILRAGLGMVDALLDLFPDAKVCHVGLFRDETTLKPTTYYQRLAHAEDSAVAIVADPMLATGGSAMRACELLREQGFRTIKVLALLAAPEGIAALRQAVPDVSVWVGAIDKRLNDIGFIDPGLGDAGDRQFAT
jgi:uracil phosphoribosyltransferase